MLAPVRFARPLVRDVGGPPAERKTRMTASPPHDRLLLATAPVSGNYPPPPGPPPTPPPISPGLDLIASRTAFGLMVVIALSAVVLLAALLAARLFRRTGSEGRHQGLCSLCCECAILVGAPEGGGNEATGSELSVRPSRHGGPNLPEPQVQINGASSVEDHHSQMEDRMSSDIEDRLRRWQVRSLESQNETMMVNGINILDCTPRTANALNEVRRTQMAMAEVERARVEEEQVALPAQQRWSYEDAINEAIIQSSAAGSSAEHSLRT